MRLVVEVNLLPGRFPNGQWIRGQASPFSFDFTGSTPALNLSYIVEVMFGRDYLGEFEHIVLLALLRLSDQAYGVTVRQEIEIRTNREVSIGAVYATLERLQKKGYVKSFRGEPTAERGGRAKRFFRVTANGLSAVNRTQQALRRMTEGLELVRS